MLVEPVADHWSDADVYRVVDHPDGPAYLKTSRHDARYPARDEAERLAWVDGRAPGPPWWRYSESADGTAGFLLTGAVPGTQLRSMAPEDPRRTTELLASAIRVVHDALPVDACPFTLTPSWLLRHSEAIVAEGGIDADYCLEVTGLPADEALAVAQATLPGDDVDLVVVHGDTYARNLIVDESQAFAWVDWGWCGVGHRWHDLGTAITWLERHCGLDSVAHFLEEYGAEVDDHALTFFRMLDGLR